MSYEYSIRLRAASVALALTLTLVLITIPSAQAQTLTVLYNFTGGSDGGYPEAGLVRDSAGNLYGTTYYAGSHNNGVVFEVDTSGTEIVLYNFTGESDGGYPHAGLVRDTAGNLYGTAAHGGSHHNGVVFKVDTNGNETVLYSFAGGGTDGCTPLGGLLRDKAGNFYGTTYGCGSSNYGTVFKLNRSGKETVLHSFTGSPDGANPYFTSLFMDNKGNLYGVTEAGGTTGCTQNLGCGTVYKLSKSGTLTVLHSFTGGTTDGCSPYGTLTTDKHGNFYGTAIFCGSSGDGIVWKLSKKNTEAVLYSFTGGAADGAYPYAGVILDAKGNLYGDTEEGGFYNFGTVYKLDKGGTLFVLHMFAESGSEGANPLGALVRDGKGNLYGTTSTAGSICCERCGSSLRRHDGKSSVAQNSLRRTSALGADPVVARKGCRDSQQLTSSARSQTPSGRLGNLARGNSYSPSGELIRVTRALAFADGHRKSGSQRVTNFHDTTTMKMIIPAKYAQPRPFWSFS